MKTTALIEKGKDGTFTIFTSELESTIIGEGNTVDEAKKSFLKSIDEIIDFYKEDGLELPEELKNVSFVFKYDISSLFDYYSFINVSKFAKKTGINSSLMRQYKRGNTSISEKQVLKIQNQLREIGKELSSIDLI